MLLRWARQQMKRFDVVSEVLYNSSSKLTQVSHCGRGMAPRLPPSSRVSVQSRLTYREGDVVAIRVPNIENEVQILRVIAAPRTEMISDDIPPRELVLGGSEYWLEADNSSANVKDSRHFGPVGASDIIGRAVNVDFGGTKHPIMHNSSAAVEEDTRNAWMLPHLVSNFSDFVTLVQSSSDPDWVQSQLRYRLRCRVMSAPQFSQSGESSKDLEVLPSPNL